MKQCLPLGELLELMRSSCIQEELTFGQLFQLTDPGRLARAKNYVRGPPLEIHANDRRAYHIFNFKSYPSTTGLRHRGYVAFKKPRDGQPQASENLPVEVDCDCPDYRYRWAWANKQHGAGKVGAGSMNKAHNRAPVVTNPSGKPSLCKHIAATVGYVQGLIQRFPGGPDDDPDTDVDVSWKIEQLVRWAQRRSDNYDAEREKAKQRMDRYRQAQAARNVAGPMPAADVPQGTEEEVPVPLPGERGMPEQPQPPEPEEPDEGETRTRNESRVVKPNSKTMNTENLKKTKAVVEAMADELDIELDQAGDLDHPAGPPEGEDVELDAELPPVEAGADQPEDEALELLRSISVGIDRLANELAPAGEPEAPEGELEEPEAPEDEDETGVPPVEDDDEFTNAMPVSTGA
jgi:hypothetical protein